MGSWTAMFMSIILYILSELHPPPTVHMPQKFIDACLLPSWQKKKEEEKEEEYDGKEEKGEEEEKIESDHITSTSRSHGL